MTGKGLFLLILWIDGITSKIAVKLLFIHSGAESYGSGLIHVALDESAVGSPVGGSITRGSAECESCLALAWMELPLGTCLVRLTLGQRPTLEFMLGPLTVCLLPGAWTGLSSARCLKRFLPGYWMDHLAGRTVPILWLIGPEIESQGYFIIPT